MSLGDCGEHNHGINISAYLSGLSPPLLLPLPSFNTVWGPEQEQMDRAGFDVRSGHVCICSFIKVHKRAE